MSFSRYYSLVTSAVLRINFDPMFVSLTAFMYMYCDVRSHSLQILKLNIRIGNAFELIIVGKHKLV